MLAMIVSESSFGAFVYHRRPVGLHCHQRSCLAKQTASNLCHNFIFINTYLKFRKRFYFYGTLIKKRRLYQLFHDTIKLLWLCLQRLMERAFGIQSELESVRSSAHAGLQREERERRLVQEHVQTVTALANQLHMQTADLRYGRFSCSR